MMAKNFSVLYNVSLLFIYFTHSGLSLVILEFHFFLCSSFLFLMYIL